MNISEGAEFIARWHAGAVTREELTRWQTSALRAVLSHVAERSPFYAKRLAGSDLEVRCPQDVARLPHTTKDDLRDAMHDMLTGDVSEAAFYFETTGTTGRPTPCPRAPIDFELNWLPLALALDSIADEHIRPRGKRPVLAVIAPNDVHSACLSLSFAAHHIGITKLDLFPISPTLGFARFFELLVELGVTMLYCSPGLLMALAEMSSAYGVEVPDDVGVDVLLTTGEMCSDSMRALLARTWDAEVFNFNYGSQEAGAPAVARPDGTQVVVEPTYLLEVLDLDNQQSLGFEGYGELCLTSLVPGLKPLIRYRTGDLARITQLPSGLRDLQVLGRVKDMTSIGGRLRSAADVDDAVLIDPESVYGYEIEISGEDDDADQLLVRLKAKNGADHEALRRAVAERVRTTFGVPVRVVTQPLLDLKSTTGGWVSWKSARIKDLRRRAVDDLESRAAAHLARAAEEAI